MRKIITIVATLAFVIALSMTAFAATANWKLDEATQTWTCTDKNGDAITEQWVKSGDQWFWLDADGKMATAQLVDDGTALYCVDEKGQMIKNNWVKVNNEDFDDKWLYFGVNGKAYENGWKTIKDVKYHFTDKAMDQGFLDASDAVIDAEVEEPWKTAVIYLGEDGGMKKNYWLEVEDFESANGKSWVFFGSNGKKVAGCKKDINGKTYVFDAEGKMITSFLDATVSSATASVSVYMDADGKMLKKGWVYAFFNDDADEQNWFYADSKGELAKSVVKTINGKKYAFDADGKMLTGFVVVDTDGKNVVKAVCGAEDINQEAAFKDYGANTFMYFTESATPSEQGAAVTGKQSFNGDGWKFTVNFSNRGLATTTDEVEIKKDYLYKNSVLVAVEDPEFKYEPFQLGGVDYVLNWKTGKVAKKGTFTDSDNEIQYKFKADGVYKYTKDANGKYTVEVKCF